jgi:hypothetical protein
MNGRGAYRYAEGDTYEGDWKNDKRHGKGKVTYVSDGRISESYDGDWFEGRMHGQGSYIYADGGKNENNINN